MLSSTSGFIIIGFMPSSINISILRGEEEARIILYSFICAPLWIQPIRNSSPVIYRRVSCYSWFTWFVRFTCWIITADRWPRKIRNTAIWIYWVNLGIWIVYITIVMWYFVIHIPYIIYIIRSFNTYSGRHTRALRCCKVARIITNICKYMYTVNFIRFSTFNKVFVYNLS